MIRKLLTLFLYKLFRSKKLPTADQLENLDLNKLSVADKASIALSDSLIHQTVKSHIYDLMWDLKKFDSFYEYGNKKDQIVGFCMKHKRALHFVNMQILSLIKLINAQGSAKLKEDIFAIFPNFDYTDTRFTDIHQKMMITSRMSLYDHERFSIEVADEVVLIFKLNRDLTQALNIVVNDDSNLKTRLFQNALVGRENLDSIFE